MNTTFILGVGFGALAALMINVGKGVQKQNVHVFLQGRKMFQKPHRKFLGGWLLGLCLTSAASVPFVLGLKFSESPSAISAMTGIGLIGLVVYAVLAIGEKMDLKDGVGIALVIVGTSAMGYLGAMEEQLDREFSDSTVLKVVLILVFFGFVACVQALLTKKLHGLSFGATAGMCLGLALFLGDAAIIRIDAGIPVLGNPFIFLGIFFGIITTVITQIGFLGGRALEVVPAFNSASIITPLVLEGIIYQMIPQTAILVFIFVIFIGVIMLSVGTVARVSA